MELRVHNTGSSISDDGLDTELDTIGVVLDTPIICGKCMTTMTPVDGKIYSCPKCNAIFRYKG